MLISRLLCLAYAAGAGAAVFLSAGADIAGPHLRQCCTLAAGCIVISPWLLAATIAGAPCSESRAGMIDFHVWSGVLLTFWSLCQTEHHDWPQLCLQLQAAGCTAEAKLECRARRDPIILCSAVIKALLSATASPWLHKALIAACLGGAGIVRPQASVSCTGSMWTG